MPYNACIDIISSRRKCLPKCLDSIHKYYNHRYDYPVYVYYFDDIYDSKDYRKKIHNNISKNIHFVKIPYKTPSHLKESELFYNRRDIAYVKKAFSISRKGYLHMCHFRCNMYGYPNTTFEKHDYAMSYDDESGYVKELPYDPVEIMANRPEDMGALICGQRLREGQPHQGHLDTRIAMWRFTRKFLAKHKITPKSKLLQDLLKDPDAERNFHFLPWADSYIIKIKMFESDLWKKWIKAVNEHGGIYRFRWGDNEIMSLFYLIYDDKPIHNLKTVEEGYHNQGLFRKVQNYAPSIKDTRR